VSRDEHKMLCLFGDRFSKDSGDLRGRGGEGVFATIGRGPSEVFEAPRGPPVPPAPYSASLRLKVSVPGIVPRFAG